jgi:hypothetical protein
VPWGFGIASCSAILILMGEELKELFTSLLSMDPWCCGGVVVFGFNGCMPWTRSLGHGSITLPDNTYHGVVGVLRRWNVYAHD